MERRFGRVLLCLIILLLARGVAEAHQPRIVTGDRPIQITEPEVSQAFYATLNGPPHLYHVTITGNAPLYVSLLVPDLPGARTDFVAVVARGEAPAQTLERLDGVGHDWTPFFEPFGGDRYLAGPGADLFLPAGDYVIEISNADNMGKYVLSVGRQERFTLGEILETMSRMRHVKRFFDKSPWAAFLNLLGVFMLIPLILIALAVAYVVKRWRRAT